MTGNTFRKYLSNWPLHGRNNLNLTYIETKGTTLEELISNAKISLQEWNGDDGPDWTLNDLPKKDYEKVLGLLKAFLQESF